MKSVRSVAERSEAEWSETAHDFQDFEIIKIGVKL